MRPQRNPMHNMQFCLWVAKAVHECGGDGDLYLIDSCGLAGLQALTFAETRMDICQEVFCFYFDQQNPASMRYSRLATTNKRWIN